MGWSVTTVTMTTYPRKQWAHSIHEDGCQTERTHSRRVRPSFNNWEWSVNDLISMASRYQAHHCFKKPNANCLWQHSIHLRQTLQSTRFICHLMRVAKQATQERHMWRPSKNQAAKSGLFFKVKSEKNSIEMKRTLYGTSANLVMV